MMPNQSRNHFQRPMSNYSVMQQRNTSCAQAESTPSCQQTQSGSVSSCQQTQGRPVPSCQQTQGGPAPSCQQPSRRPAPPCRPSGQMTKEQLLRWISYTKFACVDVSLYLDTHPCDMEALSYFQEYNRLYNEAMDEYAKAYGSLTISHARYSNTYWDWVNQPWPWQ